jgi:hypothetical protein
MVSCGPSAYDRGVDFFQDTVVPVTEEGHGNDVDLLEIDNIHLLNQTVRRDIRFAECLLSGHSMVTGTGE